MLLFFRYKEVYCGTSPERFNEVRELLVKNGINHWHRTRGRDSGLPFRGRTGESGGQSTRYYLYVESADYKMAKHILSDDKV